MSSSRHNRPNLTPESAKKKQQAYNSHSREPIPFLREKPFTSNSLNAILELQIKESVLSLEDQFIGDKGAGILADFLNNYTHFTSIELRGNNLTSASFATICNAMKNCINLINIKVDWNLVGDTTAGLEALVDLVRILPSLQTIDLRNNELGKNSGPLLAAIIKESWALQRLDLRWNELGDNEARCILGALKGDPKQMKVNLGGNKLGGNKISESLLFEINKLSNTGLNWPESSNNIIPKSSSALQNNSSPHLHKHTVREGSEGISHHKSTTNASRTEYSYSNQSLSYEANEDGSLKKIERQLDFSHDNFPLDSQNNKKERQLSSPPAKRSKVTSRSSSPFIKSEMPRKSIDQSSQEHKSSSPPNLETYNQFVSSSGSFGNEKGDYAKVLTADEIKSSYRGEQLKTRSRLNFSPKTLSRNVDPKIYGPANRKMSNSSGRSSSNS